MYKLRSKREAYVMREYCIYTMCTEKEGKEGDEMFRHSSVHGHRRCSAALCLTEEKGNPASRPIRLYIYIYTCARGPDAALCVHSSIPWRYSMFQRTRMLLKLNNACIFVSSSIWCHERHPLFVANLHCQRQCRRPSCPRSSKPAALLITATGFTPNRVVL